MTAPSVSINPAQQTNFAGTFFVSSSGYTQGDALDDPAIRNELRRGIVDPNASQPMWGGLAISESFPTGTGGLGTAAPAENLQSILKPATSVTPSAAGGLTGFSVLNQATAMIQSAQSRVPMAPAGGALSFYRLGSRARIPLKALAAAITEWLAGNTNAPADIFWDTVNLQLVNAAGSGIIGPIPGVTIDAIDASNSRVVSYNSGTNFANWVENGGTVVLRI